MKHRIAAWVVLIAFAGMWLAAPATASRTRLLQGRVLLQDKKDKDKKGKKDKDKGKKDKDKGKKPKAPLAEDDVNKLALEVIALRGLQELDPTLDQLKGLQEMYKPNFVSKARLPAGTASKNYVKNLKKLRDAYVKNDEDDIEEYTNKVEVLDEEEGPEVVGEVRPSGLAFNAAKEALRLFTARQVLDVLNSYEDDLPGPVTTLMEALEEGLDSKPEDWEKEARDAAFQASWLAFGLGNKRSAVARKDILAWLNEKHKLSKTALENQRSKLEKDARVTLFERVDPSQVLQNIIYHDVAVILSNPELPGVLTKRIRAETAKLKGKSK
jgi:hypothetical protein